jgi:ATP phosphoribosyltransferase regulatory subunit
LNDSTENLWLLPDGIEELLPADALQVEHLRRRLLDLCAGHGYLLVSPPLLEHLDSLLQSGGEDLELETFKLVDHNSGRQLGIRADMTPQIARIDAHLLGSEGTTRLCYSGPVLRARPRQTFESRELMQLGAELYGCGHRDADVEVIELLLECLTAAGLAGIGLDIGHVGITRAMAQSAGIVDGNADRLFDALQRKSIPDLEQLVAGHGVPSALAEALVELPEMYGPVADLPAALARLSALGAEIAAAAADLSTTVGRLQARCPDSELYFDLAEMRGYDYHTGVVFTAFVEGFGREIARGGRYDSVGAIYGRSRPATGFSLDLRQLAKLAAPGQAAETGGILAPADGDEPLNEKIRSLRRAGERVVRQLGDDREVPQGCDRWLVRGDDGWTVAPLVD